MTVMERVRAWLQLCPSLSGRFDVDFLDEDADTYSVDSVPSDSIIKRYMDGSTVRQFIFVLSSRRFFSQNIRQNLDNLQIFEDVTSWIEHQNKIGNLPNMNANQSARRCIVTSTAYPFIVSEDGKARYQIQMRLEYFQKQ